jgi:threonine/homoserine/homoserine lactone efflux protein
VPDRLAAFALVSLVIIAIPGPGVLFVIGRALSSGRRVALLSAVGQESGGFLLVVAVALGVGSLMERSVLVFSTVKLAGAAYLVYLGVRAIRERHADAPASGAAGRRGLGAIRDGLAVGVTNPKGAVFFAAVLPQFTDRTAGHLPLQMLMLGGVFVAIALACDALWSLLAAAARGWLERSPSRLARVRGAGGLAMIGLGVSVAVSGNRAK